MISTRNGFPGAGITTVSHRPNTVGAHLSGLAARIVPPVEREMPLVSGPQHNCMASSGRVGEIGSLTKRPAAAAPLVASLPALRANSCPGNSGGHPPGTNAASEWVAAASVNGGRQTGEGWPPGWSPAAGQSAVVHPSTEFEPAAGSANSARVRRGHAGAHIGFFNQAQ